jgi:hypothetical protein
MSLASLASLALLCSAPLQLIEGSRHSLRSNQFRNSHIFFVEIRPNKQARRRGLNSLKTVITRNTHFFVFLKAESLQCRSRHLLRSLSTKTDFYLFLNLLILILCS